MDIEGDLKLLVSLKTYQVELISIENIWKLKEK